VLLLLVIPDLNKLVQLTSHFCSGCEGIIVKKFFCERGEEAFDDCIVSAITRVIYAGPAAHAR
jgi:hypothetical protein